jgi:hypothetical protein
MKKMKMVGNLATLDRVEEIKKKMKETVLDHYYRVNLQDFLPPVPTDIIFGLI